MIPLPRHRPDEIRVLNRIFCRREAITAELGGKTFALRPWAGEAAILDPFWLEFELDGRLAWLALDPALVDRLLDGVLSGLDRTSLDPTLLAMLVELALAPLIEAVEASGGRRIGFRRLGAPEPAERLHMIAFRLAPSAGAPFLARLHLAAESLGVVAALLEQPPLAPHPAADLPLILACRVGTARLTRGELASVGAGDFVVLTQSGVARGQVELVLNAAVRFPARLEHQTITIEGGPARTMAEDDTNGPDGQPAPETAPDLDSVPVTLTFELGRLPVPLGELRLLGPGHGFDLGRDLRSPVDIMAGGKKIGSGELIQIDERVGVRVTRLFDNE